MLLLLRSQRLYPVLRVVEHMLYPLGIHLAFVDFSPHMQRLLWQMQTTLEPPLAQGSSSVLAVLVFGSTPSMRGLFVYLLPIERPLPMQGKLRPHWTSFFLTLEPTLRKQRKGVIRRKGHLFLRTNPACGEFVLFAQVSGEGWGTPAYAGKCSHTCTRTRHTRLTPAFAGKYILTSTAPTTS